MKKNIVVVGSGISGLSAAYDLQKMGNQVTVIESSDYIGGRMADQNIRGLNVHTGATIIWDYFKEMIDLCEDLGIKDKLHEWTRTETDTHNGEKSYTIKYHFSVSDMMSHKAFSAGTKLRLAKLLPDIVRAGLKTDPCLMHTAAEFDDESVAEYLTRKGVVDFLENYIEPLFRAPWNWEPEDFSKAYLLNTCAHLPTAKTHTFKDGIGSLTRELGRRLNVRLSTTVLSITNSKEDSTSEVVIEGIDGKETLIADIVLVTTPADRVIELVQGLSKEERQFFESVRYNACGIVYYILKEEPEEEKIQWFTRKHKSPVVFYSQIARDPHVPDGHDQPPHLYLELSPQQRDKAIEEGNTGNLQQYVHEFAKEMYPTVEEDTVDVVEQWVPQMLPTWYPGYARKLASFLEKFEAIPRRVYVAGDYLSNSHTGGACASGRRAARLIADHHG